MARKMFLSLLRLALLLPAAVVAVPLAGRAAGQPSVTFSAGTVLGATNGRVESFKGIPFAEPPVGNMRLRPAVPLAENFGTINGSEWAPACPQQFGQFNSSSAFQGLLASLGTSAIFQQAMPQSEDCLFNNVQRPVGTTANASLPVLVYIYGGGFELGSVSTYDGTNLVNKSIDLDQPIIYVLISYRVGAFGYMPGKLLAEEGSTNLGYRDQVLALKWVADNIAAFGGDPDKVTIWGESAGSISVVSHMLFNGGDNTYNGKPLFRGIIGDSGSLFGAVNVTSPKAQGIYDTAVRSAGCPNDDTSLECLRSLNFTDYVKATENVPFILGYEAINIAYCPRPDNGDDFYPVDPIDAVAAGRYAKVSVISGDQEDEGTLFSLFSSNLTTAAELLAYHVAFYPDNPNAEQEVAGLHALYPDDPSGGQPEGSPFYSGSKYNIYKEYKRMAAIMGDIQFIMQRRSFLSHVSSVIPTWSYLSTWWQAAEFMGTFHGSDILYAWGLLNESDFRTQTFQGYFLSFVYHLDPNQATNPAISATNWPKWSNATGQPQLLNIGMTNNSILIDDFRSDVYDYITAHPYAWDL